MTLPKLKGPAMVGRAWRCADGLIRWVIARTPSTGNLRVLWLDEKTGTWYPGGMYHPRSWFDAEHGAPVEEVQAPQIGEEYRYCSVGLTDTRIVGGRRP